MTQRALPFDGTNYFESDWRTMMENVLTSGVLRGQLDELEVFADSTGMNVKVPTGKAWLRGHTYISDAQETLPIGNSDGANPRIDRVVLRLDPTANSIVLAILEGVPAVDPDPPALTQTDATYETSLAQVTVDAAAATIAAGDVVDERKYSQPPGAEPVGSAKMWFAAAAPEGWLLCQGQAVSRVTYAALFDLIGTTFGVGDGSTTFNLPNLKKRFPVGVDPATGAIDAVGETGGTWDHFHTQPGHTHTFDPADEPVAPPNHTHDGQVPSSGGAVAGSTNAGTTSSSGGDNTGTANPPFFTVNFIVKV